MQVLICPRCRNRLTRSQGTLGVFYECPDCQGRAVSLPVLRKVIDPGALNHLWNRVLSSDTAPGVPCPACSRPTREVAFTRDGQTDLVLDVCQPCAFWWFDPREIERLPVRTLPPPKPELSQAGKEAVAIAQTQLQRENMYRESGVSPGDGPESAWKWFPALLSTPVEHTNLEANVTPWVTWLTAAAILVLSVLSRNGDIGVFDEQSLKSVATWLAVLNVLFLLLFGDRAEDNLGHGQFLLLLLVSALAGSLAYWGFQAQVNGLLLAGFTASVAGVAVYYTFRYPRHRVLVFLGRWTGWFAIPAWFGFLGWLGWQALTVWATQSSSRPMLVMILLSGAAVGWIASRIIAPPRV